MEEACPGGRKGSTAGITRSNPPDSTDVSSVVFVCCVGKRPVRQADHTGSVCVSSCNGAAYATVGLLCHCVVYKEEII